jgi:Family of unknown function (DUF6279)
MLFHSRLILILCSFFLLGGCTTKVAYNFLDWAVAWKVQRLVPLDGELRQQAKTAIGEFHLWHRQTQLPQYATYLDELKIRLNADSPLTAEDIHAETDKVQLLLDQSLTFSLPYAVKLLGKLDQADTNELLKNIAEERDEYIDEYVDITLKKQIKKRNQEFIVYFKQWLSAPEPSQKAKIEAWAKTMEPYEQATAKQQLLWETRLAEVLKHRQNPEALEQGLNELMFYRTDNWDTQLQGIMDRNQQKTYSLIADLLNHLTTKQRRHLNKKLTDLAQTFRELNQEKGRG